MSEKYYTAAGKGITGEEEMAHTSASLLFASLPPFSVSDNARGLYCGCIRQDCI